MKETEIAGLKLRPEEDTVGPPITCMDEDVLKSRAEAVEEGAGMVKAIDASDPEAYFSLITPKCAYTMAGEHCIPDIMRQAYNLFLSLAEDASQPATRARALSILFEVRRSINRITDQFMADMENTDSELAGLAKAIFTMQEKMEESNDEDSNS